MDLTTQNGNNNGIQSGLDPNASRDGQENISDSLLDSSEMGDEADLDVMRRRIKEMEEEAEKLKLMQLEVEKQMQLPGTPGTRKSQNEFFDIHLDLFLLISSFSNDRRKNGSRSTFSLCWKRMLYN